VAMSRYEDILRHRQAILELAARYGAHDVRLFGSVACGDDRPDSDVDLLVRFDPDRSLLDHGGLIADLEDLLGGKVDVIDEGGIRPRWRGVVLKEAVAL
jgi:uncharacterized protein